MMGHIIINNRKIGRDYAPYVIAEMSANHNGDISRALKIIDEAKSAGADAIKLQTYTPDTITLNCDKKDFQISGGLWDGQSLYELYQDAHMPWEWHHELFQKAHDVGITIFSSPFDYTAVDYLEDLNVPAYKIASFELVDLPLIKYVAQTGKPLIMSTGMANEKEITAAIETATSSGCDSIAILHCVSGYPAPADEYNLKTIEDLYIKHNVPVGLSDHTLDNVTAITSIAMGACIIEKHVTLDKTGNGPDDAFSIDPSQLHKLCNDVRSSWLSLGKINYELTENEKGNLKFRRSLYVVSDLKKGDKFTEDNIKCIRPGYGLSPNLFEYCIGKKAKKNISRGTPLSKDLIQDTTT